jgi:excisionase family DNA binding protein
MGIPTDSGKRSPGEAGNNLARVLLTVPEVANLLRTTPRAVYAMVERNQLPGVVRLRRRVLFRTEVLLDWVHQKSAPSLEE